MRIQNLSKYDGKRAFAAKFYDMTKAKDRSLVLFHISISGSTNELRIPKLGNHVNTYMNLRPSCQIFDTTKVKEGL